MHARPFLLDIEYPDFPTFAELPEPLRCCFICEITRNVSRGRPVYEAKDLAGRTICVAFYHDDASEYAQLPRGTTVCVNQAKPHFFVDGQRGLRLEEGSDVTILNCGLDELKGLSDFLQSNDKTKCTQCHALAAPKKCIACKVPYCNVDCERKDWRSVHKRLCKVVQHLRKLNESFG